MIGTATFKTNLSLLIFQSHDLAPTRETRSQQDLKAKQRRVYVAEKTQGGRV